MPSKNITGEYSAPAYYHIYNRSASNRKIFHDVHDKRKFLSLFERYLSKDSAYEVYPTYAIELVAFCVMDNHYHLLIFQDSDSKSITQLMRSVSTAYSVYYNLKYKTNGPVFKRVLKASRITSDEYLIYITRYIHLNPSAYLTYKWSSLRYYLGKHSPDWINPQRLLDMTPAQYRVFLQDYEDRHQLLKEIKEQLAI